MVLRFCITASIAVLILACVSSERINGEYYTREPTTYQTPPHIIVIMADDLGWNDIGFHGSNQIPTPNIDALAYNGIILNRHYVMPSCTPSRAAFLTGRYPIRMGMQGQGIKGGEPRGIPLDVHTLPEHLKGLGYVTRLIGKWHVGYHTRQHTPLQRGFDSFLGFYNSHISYFDYKYDQGNLSGFDMHRGDNAYRSPKNDYYVTDVFTDEASRVIDEHDPSRPLFLQISHLAVHPPLEIPHENNRSDEFWYIREPNRRSFAAMLTRLDNSVGRVVASLGSKGLLKDSVILFMSDNGAASVGKYRNFGSNWPLRGTKYTLYEGGVRGVAAIWSPRLHETTRVSEQLMHITDWLPTLYSAAGGNLKDLGDIDGVDQWPSLSEGRGSARDSLLLNIDEVSGTEAAIYNRYKLLRGSFDRGYYDGYYGESGRYLGNVTYNTSIVLASMVSKSITSYLGGPVTQPSAMTNLRLKATVDCPPYPNQQRRRNFSTCNETECLFDIFNDPCETKNIFKEYPKWATDLDLFLAKYGNVLMKQASLPVDWHADPRSFNGTWEPWLSNSGPLMQVFTSAATAVSTLAVCAHIAMVLLIVGLRAFL